eukprot:g18584.t2
MFNLSSVSFKNVDGYILSSTTNDTRAFLVESKMVWEVSGGSSTTETLNESTGNDSTSIASSISTYFEHVFVFLEENEPDKLDKTTYLTIPYQPVTSATVETTDSYLTIGKTIKTALSGDKETSFPALTLSQSKYKTARTPDAPAVLKKGPFSYTTIKELNPLEIGTFLGNLGGFWELLIIVWGICFVLQRQNRGPALKRRRFRTPGQRKGKARARAMTPAPGGWDADAEADEMQHQSAHSARPTGASGHAASQGGGSVQGYPLSETSKGQPRRHSADGTNSNRSSAGTAVAGLGRSFFRPSFRLQRNKRRGSLDNTDYAAMKKAAGFRRTVELENPVRTGSGAHQSRGEL